jgi:hypothetical protein
MGMTNKLKTDAFAKLLAKTGLSQEQLKSMGIEVLEASSNEGRILENASKVLASQEDKAVQKDMNRLVEIVNNKDVLNVAEGNELIIKYKDDFVYSKMKTIDKEKKEVDCYPRLSIKIESVEV